MIVESKIYGKYKVAFHSIATLLDPPTEVRDHLKDLEDYIDEENSVRIYYPSTIIAQVLREDTNESVKSRLKEIHDDLNHCKFIIIPE